MLMWSTVSIASLFIFLDALNPVTDDDIAAERLDGIGEVHKDPCLEVP